MDQSKVNFENDFELRMGALQVAAQIAIANKESNAAALAQQIYEFLTDTKAESKKLQRISHNVIRFPKDASPEDTGPEVLQDE